MTNKLTRREIDRELSDTAPVESGAIQAGAVAQDAEQEIQQSASGLALGIQRRVEQREAANWRRRERQRVLNEINEKKGVYVSR